MTDPADQLRSMLLTRAADVQDLPPHLAHLTDDRALTDDPAGRPRGPVQRWLITASAAAVLAVGATTGLVAVHSSDSAPQHRPTTSRTRSTPATPSTPPPAPQQTTSAPSTPVASPTPVVCNTVERAAWSHALMAGFHNPEPHANNIVAVDPNGVAFGSFSSRDSIERINRDGTLSRILGPLPGLNGGPTEVGVDADYLVAGVPLTTGTGSPGPTSIYLVTRATGAVRTVRRARRNEATIVLGPALLRGHVYWTEVDAGHAATTGRVLDYDIAAGTTRTAGTGATSEPMVSGGGLYWTDMSGRLVVNRRGTLPRGFAPLPLKTYGNFISDGVSAAWLRYRGDEPQVVLQQGDGTPHVVAAGDALAGRVDAVSGPLLFWHTAAGAEIVYDMRTRVVARNVLTDLVTDAPVAANGLLTLPGPNGGFSIVRTAALPPLHCP